MNDFAAIGGYATKNTNLIDHMESSRYNVSTKYTDIISDFTNRSQKTLFVFQHAIRTTRREIGGKQP